MKEVKTQTPLDKGTEYDFLRQQVGMKEVKTQTPLDKGTEHDFLRDPYLITDRDRRNAELRRDLSQLRDSSSLPVQQSWRAFLTRSAEQIRALPRQASPEVQKLKEQATEDYNRLIRRLQYEGMKDIPPELSQDSPFPSRKTHESQVIQTYGLDLPSGKQAQQDLHALRAEVEARKNTLEQRASSREAQRQQWDYNELAATYNRWIERQGAPETWKQPEFCLKGGMYLHERASGDLFARILTLRDPTGTEDYRFCRGETSTSIAKRTEQWIEQNGSRVVVHGRRTKVGALTKKNVEQLRQGDSLHGWRCVELTLDPVQKRTVYTDKGTELIAVSAIPYEVPPYEVSLGELPSDFQGIVLGLADPNRDCYGTAFLEGRGRLWADGNEIQAILDDNNYDQISDFQQAKYGDICIYKKNGVIKHAAPVFGWAKENSDLLSSPPRLLFELPVGSDGQYHQEDYHLKVRSKYGDGLDLGHDWNDPGIIQKYGQPTLYRTNRAGGNTLVGA